MESKEEKSAKFFEAIRKNNIAEIIKFYKDDSISPWEFLEDGGNTGLHRAVYMDFPLIVIQILQLTKSRISINNSNLFSQYVNCKSTQGYTALHYASYRGNIEIIKVLIENGAEIETPNVQGINVLHMAAQGNQPASFVYFVEKYKLSIQGVDIAGSTPLHWACYSGSEDMINFLLAYEETDLNAQDKEGFTPLHLSILSGITNNKTR